MTSITEQTQLCTQYFCLITGVITGKMHLCILAVVNTSESYPWYTLTVIIHDIESGWATYK